MNAHKRSLIILIVFLTSCAPPKPASEAAINKPMTQALRKEQTARFSSWKLAGAMAAKSQAKAFTASLVWQQKGANNYLIRLFGPLGGGSVIIEKKGKMITYKDGPKTVSSKNAAELLLKETGIRLPVNNLFYWVRALPAPGRVQSTKYDQYNHLTMLKQGGYSINYISYTSKGGVDLPSKIRLEGPDLLLKLVIKTWTV